MGSTVPWVSTPIIAIWPPMRTASMDCASVPPPPTSTTWSTPSPAGQLPRRRGPVRRAGVVDRPPRAHVTGAAELVVAFRRDDRARADEDAELKREDRYPAGAEQQHRVARLEAALVDQRVPRRQRGAGQGRCLRVVEMRGNRHDPPGVEHDLFREHAVERSAQGACHRGRRDAACRPVLKEAPGDRSPSAMPETPGPTAVTSPAPSELGTRGKAKPLCAGARTVLRSR